VRPDHPDPEADPELMRRSMDRRTGSEFVIRELMMSVLRESYEDTLAAAEGADLLVSHRLTFTPRLVAEKRGIPWASTFLQPLGLFSVYDPPVVPQAPLLAKLWFLGPAFHRLLFWCAKRSVRSWAEPWHRLRAEVGLPPTSESPLFEGQYSPSLVLAMSSKLLADKQPDWPRQAVITGFPFYDRDGEGGMPPELVRFLDAGPPPPGLYARLVGGGGRRPVLRKQCRRHQAAGPQGRPAGRQRPSEPTGLTSRWCRGVRLRPLLGAFPTGCCHRPPGRHRDDGAGDAVGSSMLVMPYAHDQPDNAERVKRLGIARTIPRHRYTPARAAAELRHLLDKPAYSQRAAEVGAEIRQEDGVRTACGALEGLLQVARPAEVVAE